MEKLILIVHLLTALAMIGLILLQQGKGAEAGASFGAGASQTIFGSSGSWNFFSKMTAVFATVFFVTSFGLAIMAKDRAGIEEPELPMLEQVNQAQLEAESELPDVAGEEPTPEEATDGIPVIEESEAPPAEQ